MCPFTDSDQAEAVHNVHPSKLLRRLALDAQMRWPRAAVGRQRALEWVHFIRAVHRAKAVVLPGHRSHRATSWKPAPASSSVSSLLGHAFVVLR